MRKVIILLCLLVFTSVSAVATLDGDVARNDAQQVCDWQNQIQDLFEVDEVNAMRENIRMFIDMDTKEGFTDWLRYGKWEVASATPLGEGVSRVLWLCYDKTESGEDIVISYTIGEHHEDDRLFYNMSSKILSSCPRDYYRPPEPSEDFDPDDPSNWG